MMKIKSKKTLNSHQYLKYRTKPKEFQLKINTPKPKNPNPLYSTDSLAKYFNLPTTDLNLTVNRSPHHKHTQSSNPSTNLKPKKENKLIKKFNEMQESMRLYHMQCTVSTKRKFRIMEQYNTKVQDHFIKIKNSTNEDDFPRIEVDLDVGLDNRYTKTSRNESKRRLLSLRSKTIQLRKQIHAQNIRSYLQNEQNWTRYGYSLEVDDQQQLLKTSIQRRNKNLRDKYHSMDKKAPILKLKRVLPDKQIFEDSKFYMKIKMKTEGNM